MKRGTLRRWAELWPIRVSCLFRHLQCCAGPFDDACLTGWLRLLQVIESDVALALGASPGKVKVLSLRAGSVIASVVLRDGVLSDGRSPMDALVELQRQAQDPTSAFMAGQVTSRCVAIHSDSAAGTIHGSDPDSQWPGFNDPSNGVEPSGRERVGHAMAGVATEDARNGQDKRVLYGHDDVSTDALGGIEHARARGPSTAHEGWHAISSHHIALGPAEQPAAQRQSGWVLSDCVGEDDEDQEPGQEAVGRVCEAVLPDSFCVRDLEGAAPKSHHWAGADVGSLPDGKKRALHPSFAHHEMPSVPEIVAAVAEEEMTAELTNVEIDVHVRELVDADVRAGGESVASSCVHGTISFSWVVSSTFDVVRLRRAPPAEEVSFVLAVSNLHGGDLVAHDPRMAELVDTSNLFLPLSDDGAQTVIFRCRIPAKALSERRACIKYALTDPARAPCFPLHVSVHQEVHCAHENASADAAANDLVETVTIRYSVEKNFR